MFNIWEVGDKIAVIAKKQVFYVWPFGLLAYLAGVVFIDRSNPKNAYKQLEIMSDVMIKDKVRKTCKTYIRYSCLGKPVSEAVLKLLHYTVLIDVLNTRT